MQNKTVILLFISILFNLSIFAQNARVDNLIPMPQVVEVKSDKLVVKPDKIVVNGKFTEVKGITYVNNH